jgi:uncharacterized protein YciU (UPF0263 family)
MKRLAPFKEEFFEFEELKPKVKYAELLQPDTDWAEEVQILSSGNLFSSNINGLSDEHRDDGRVSVPERNRGGL